MIVYDRLWETLKDKNISQYSLMKDYGVDKAQIHRLKHNMIVKTITINNLCRILNCNVEDIMQYVPDEPQKE
ncbi:MAG: helix-turn-helix transcriptional regulator [Lachnospiraceae bacterium]|nr:helix-turn-helix transcriptional regulator [Lachnospiraceae bacterium]MBQ3513904.1 helix-turn-helix transcriptional regulator [Lachnospiraceae bacterium]